MKLNGQAQRQEDTPAYLGVTFDHMLIWKNQLQRNQARAKIRLALMKKLSCTGWGPDHKVLKKSLCGNPPSLWMWNAANFTTAKSNSSKLSRVQHQAMRMTGTMQSMPISAMQMVTGLHPLTTDRKSRYWHRLQRAKDSWANQSLNA